MNRLQTPLVRLAGLALCLAALPCLPASAHDVSPAFAELRPGTSSLIYVEDFQFNCKADITVQTSDPSVVQVWALDPLTGLTVPGNGIIAFVPDAKVAYFLITGGSGVTSTVTVPISVCWVGEGYPNGTTCLENNCSPIGIPHVIPVTVKPTPFTSGALGNAGVAGDPVSTATGEVYTERRELLSLGGPLPLVLGMQYGSMMEASGIPPGFMGPGWRNDTDWVLRIVGDGAYEVTLPDGRVARFRRGPPDWGYVLETYLDVPFQLSRPNPGLEYKLFDPRSGLVYSFSNVGSLGVASRAIRVEDGKGNVQTRTATANGPVTKIVDGLGRQITLTHVGGKLSLVSDGTRTLTLTYDGQGQFANWTDADGHTTSFIYDPAFPGQGQLVAEQRPEGNAPFTQVFDSQKRVVQQADAANNITTLLFGPANLTTVNDPLGHKTEHLHDEGKLTTHTDPKDNAIGLGYNADEQRTSITDRKGNTTSFSVHAPSGGIEQLTEATGAVTTIDHSARTQSGFEVWDVKSELLADGTVRDYVYDAVGNLLSATDGDGFAWTFTYNSKGQVLTATDPSGAVRTRTYNPDGTLATFVTPNGDTTAFSYDAFKRLVGVQNPDLTSVSWTLDARGLVTSSKNEAFETTLYTYDDNGRLTSTTYPSGASEGYAYDTQDRLERHINGLAQQTTYEYDQRDQLKRILQASGRTWEGSHDSTGFLSEFADPGNAKTLFQPDGEGLNESTTDPLGRKHVYAYDQAGRRTSHKLPGGALYTYARDPLGAVTQITDPQGAVTTFVRNGRRLVTQIIGPMTGVMVNATYDERGLLLQLADPGANATEYTYDTRGNRTKIKDALGREQDTEFDSRGFPSKVTLPGALGHVDILRTTDGLPSSATGSDGSTRTRTYDADNRINGGDHISIDYDVAGRISISNGLQIEHDVDGRVSKVTLAPGDFVTYSYGLSGELQEMVDSWGTQATFTYNAAKQVTEIQRSSGPTAKYDYGPDGRCSKEQHGSIYEAELVYDGRGKLTGKKVFSAPQVSSPLASSLTCAYDPANQRIGDTWDDAGRMLADNKRQCTWNALDDLTECSDGTTTLKCEYDTFGRLYSRETVGSGVVQSFVWNDACGGGPAIVRENGVDTQFFATTPGGLPLWEIDPATGHATWILIDIDGNTLGTTDDTGTPQCGHEYLPHGEPLATWGSCNCTFTFGAAFGNVYEPTCELLLTAQGPVDTTFGRRMSPRQIELGLRSSNGYAAGLVFRPTPDNAAASRPVSLDLDAWIEQQQSRRVMDGFRRATASDVDKQILPWSQKSPDDRIRHDFYFFRESYGSESAVGKYTPSRVLQLIAERTSRRPGGRSQLGSPWDSIGTQETSEPKPRDPFWNYGTVLPERPEGWRSGEPWYARRERLERERPPYLNPWHTIMTGGAGDLDNNNKVLIPSLFSAGEDIDSL